MFITTRTSKNEAHGGYLVGACSRMSEPGAGDMAQQIREVVALPEDQGSIPSIHTVVHKYL